MPESRRRFLKQTAAAVALAGVRLTGFSAAQNPAASPTARAGTATGPWYRRALRWGQTNITEIDPTRYDIAWWREHWKRTQVQGVVVNAGGIVAYYPSALPLQYRAQFLGDRDLFGEVCRAAHEEGLAVFARMDSNSAHEDFYRAHPDWFAVDASGRPYRNRELYVSCVNSPYYDEHIPAVLREVATRYRPEGFTDNSWSGLGRSSPCFCANCERKFRERTGGKPIPRARNWSDPVYREWIDWNYARRIEIWENNNRVTRAAGGPDCVWVGMNGGGVSGQAAEFRDFKAICERAEIIMLDDQRRQNDTGFQRNGEVGLLVHGLLGWDKVMPESMAMYQTTAPTFRLSAKPAAEARLWMLEGFAGGIQPWWHHVGAVQEDRRQFAIAEPVMRWHAAHEEFLVHRRPVATVGVAWSQRNADFFGRDDAELIVDAPRNGFMQALVRARIPYLPVHLDHLERDAAEFGLRVLVLPNLGAMTGPQVESVRRFVARGGGLLATGHSSLGGEYGDAFFDYALADLFGAHLPEKHGAREESSRRRWAAETAHSYLRIESPAKARPEIFRGFEETDILPFGGTLEPLALDPSARALATFIPSFPAFPPELSWMREPKTGIPALIVNEKPGAGRVAFLPADLDRRYARDNLPDHAQLLANLVRWCARDEIPLAIEGPGLIDAHVYVQREASRIVLHLVNLTSAGTWRAPVEELIAVGPLHVRVQLPVGVRGRELRLLVSSDTPRLAVENGWARFELKSILDHEVVVIA
ncbi:MAG TPA: alpha-amylase family protein [Opitutaceae bacterium]|nr:alpha-amylase family protein [Opitutaceae bacterium]